MGDVRQAKIELEKASDMVTDDPVIKEHLGDVYVQIGQIEKALVAYEESYELYEDEEKKQNISEKINSLKSRGER
jgi:predicted negative regulator of RcsB-dependent stress response